MVLRFKQARVFLWMEFLLVVLTSHLAMAQYNNFNRRAERPLAEQVCFSIINRVGIREECHRFIKDKSINERLARFCLFENSRDGLMAAQTKLDCIKGVADLSPFESGDKSIDATVLSEVCGKIAKAESRMQCLRNIKGKKFGEAAKTVCQTYPLSSKPLENNFSTEDATWCLGVLSDSKLDDKRALKCFERDQLSKKRSQDEVSGCLKTSIDEQEAEQKAEQKKSTENPPSEPI